MWWSDRRRDPEVTDVGEFEVTGMLVVTDPCYDFPPGTSGINAAFEAEPGTWRATVRLVDSFGRRPSHLVVYHGDHELSHDDPSWTSLGNGPLGVDSGQMGVFALERFPHGRPEQFEYDDNSSFYRRVCDSYGIDERGRDIREAGVVPEGVVSRSGHGDGCYPVYSVARDGRTVAVMVEFIPDEEHCEDCGDPIDECSCDDFCPDCQDHVEDCLC